MPRQNRLDIPGVLHHVIARGIERSKLFNDNVDREEFLKRLSAGLSKTGCRCYAWSLMPNHFHLLIRTGNTSLSELMRKVLTGYAIYFNRRNRRHGHLFQNRYKSILCQEDTYFLELVRYIHLNPLRTKLVTKMHTLDNYSWTGHAVLLGKKKRDWQTVDEVLLCFSQRRATAIRKYREFIRDGLGMGMRKDLTGGGLKRSAGGWEGVKVLKESKEYWQRDERILGSGDFVNMVLSASEEKIKRREKLKREGWDLDRLVNKVCKLMSVNSADLNKKGRGDNLSNAKGLIAFWGYTELGISCTALSNYFGISQPAISKALSRGEEVAKQKKIKLLNYVRPYNDERIATVQSELRSLGNKEIAAHSQRFFKTGKGEYGEGDIFLGIRVPVLRKMVRKHRGIAINEVSQLLTSQFHEERLLALFMLVDIFKRAREKEQKKIYALYLDNTKFINNWDLVDSSAGHIVGAYLLKADKKTLYTLAQSSSLWERRISILSTSHFIAHNKFTDTLKIAQMLLHDEEDLIHKAVGWMLREIGKRDREVEEGFLKKHYKNMPRTMLRYAIEKFPEEKRKSYLKGTL